MKNANAHISSPVFIKPLLIVLTFAMLMLPNGCEAQKAGIGRIKSNGAAVTIKP